MANELEKLHSIQICVRKMKTKQQKQEDDDEEEEDEEAMVVKIW